MRIRAAIAVQLLVLITTAVASHAQADRHPPALTPVELRADLAVFRSDFLGVERSYSTEARRQAESRVAALEAALDTVDRGYFELEIARIVALADNGHTNAFASTRATHFNRVPLRFAPLGSAFHVLAVRAPHADLLGARLIAIDARPVADLRGAARTLTGGTEARRDAFAPFLFESPRQLHILGLIPDSAAATYRLQLADGRTVDRRITAEPASRIQPAFNTSQWLFPASATNQGTEWRSLISVEKAPWALRDATVPFRWRDAPELGAIVVEFRQNFGRPGQTIELFMTEVEAELQRRRPRNLILDMRLNGGGNLQLTREFAKRLPTLVPGRIFVLTSRWTFSAAISTIGYLKQAAPDRVTIVGEEVGDRLEFWAEGGPVTLRHSGIQIGRARERHDYANGCRAFTDCHGAVVAHPIAVRSLSPDVAAGWSVAAIVAGRDPAMDAVAAALR